MFFLSYGGANLGSEFIENLTIPRRQWFVDKLVAQKEYEKKEMDKARSK